jgi:hypothetical protein
LDAALVINQLANELEIRLSNLHNIWKWDNVTIGVIFGNLRFTLDKISWKRPVLKGFGGDLALVCLLQRRIFLTDSS